MNLSRFLVRLPERVATGGFVLHSGLQKLEGDDDTANALHGMAAAAYPFLGNVKPARFLRYLALAEVTVGLLLLVPFIPRGVAGLALSAFSGGLVGLYFRTPGLREPNSIWPTPDGLALAKDVWLLGVGSSLVLDAMLSRSRKH